MNVLSTALFEDAVAWLRDGYSTRRFFQEYEIAWLARCRILDLIAERELPYIAYHNHPVIPGYKVDLAIIDPTGLNPIVLEAVEWKYEPDHSRARDFRRSQLDPCVTEWVYIVKDVERIHECVRRFNPLTGTGARSAYSVLIDEGGFHRRRHPVAPTGSRWLEWPCPAIAEGHVSVLWGEAKPSSGP